MSTLAEDYLSGYNGSIQTFYNGLASRHRLGQAFFNALSLEDQTLLCGTMEDPFFKDDAVSVHRAIEFLLDRK